MTSLRLRLFLTLVLMTALVWSAAAIWINVRTRDQVERVLDQRLVEAARMVGSLVASGTVPASAAPRLLASPATPAGVPDRPPAGYDRQLSCQIWSFGGRLIGRSAGAPAQPLSHEASGFSEREIEGQTWRVYTFADPAAGVRVLVGDSLSVRQRLVADVTTGLLLPALLGLIALAGLIWSAVGRGLAPLRRIADSLESRKPDDLSPLSISPVASELQPFVQAMDRLLAKLATVRDGERHLIASAAHELQTPLAGMRTQAQIALATDDAKVRDRAQRQIMDSVDRTARLVRQLLDLATHEARAAAPPREWLEMRTMLNLVQVELDQALCRADVALDIDPELERASILMNPESLLVVLRNLVENAIQQSPPRSRIRCGLERREFEAIVFVDDEGPGIADDEIALVRNRFVRGRHSRGIGSGLGLSIVELTLAQSEAGLLLENRATGGLRAAFRIPWTRLRLQRAGAPQGNARSSPMVLPGE